MFHPEGCRYPMKEDVYRTIQFPSEGIYKEKGSKFLAFAFPVKSADEVKEHLDQLRKAHHTARHHCFAYRLGATNDSYRMNDDGEPSGTAGKPIYGQILSWNITNIAIFVVRYFGGTLLGTPGLIRSYKAAAADALENAQIIERTEDVLFNIGFRYPQMNEVMRIIKDLEVTVIEQNFELECIMRLAVRKSFYMPVTEKLKAIEYLTLYEN